LEVEAGELVLLVLEAADEAALLVVVPDDAGAVFPAVVGAAVPGLPLTVTFGLTQLLSVPVLMLIIELYA